MSKRAVFSVASGSYVRGQERLRAALHQFGGFGEHFISWADSLPPGCPPHDKARESHAIAGTNTHRVEPNPYAFKAWALQSALSHHSRPSTLLWCDASILPVAPLAPLWERIEREGYWIARNGWTNYEWTADAAYPLLFPEARESGDWSSAREFNKQVPHVTAGAFGLSLDHEIGRKILAQYFHLAELGAFRGPWTNGPLSADGRTAPCGPPDVLGHRHDQTALSLIAWRLGCRLTDCPEILSYPTADGSRDPRTILELNGAY